MTPNNLIGCGNLLIVTPIYDYDDVPPNNVAMPLRKLYKLLETSPASTDISQ